MLKNSNKVFQIDAIFYASSSGSVACLIRSVAEVDVAQNLFTQSQVVIVAVHAQHSPDCFQATSFNEKRMQEEEASKRQACLIHALQKCIPFRIV